MKKEQYAAYLKQKDEETRPERADRRFRLGPASFGPSLPGLLWTYLGELGHMYENGHFPGAILFSAAIVESVLKDQLRGKRALITREKRSRLTRAEQAQHLGIITKQEQETIDEMQRYRDAVIHVLEEKLAKIGKEFYPVTTVVDGKEYEGDLGALTPFIALGLGDVGGKTLDYVTFATSLCINFYGERKG